MAKSIESELSQSGFKLFGQNKVENLILSILKQKNERYFKAIPFLIYLHDINLIKIMGRLNNLNDKSLFDEIIFITKKIFLEHDIIRRLPPITLKKVDLKLNYLEFKQEFELQVHNLRKPSLLSEKEKIYSERNLQMRLSQIFTKKEKEIIGKIFGGRSLTKTEYEYYSRKTKKKLTAIINLKEFAKSIVPLSPVKFS